MEVLSLENLPEYDGGSLAVLVNRAFRDAYLDLDDRPNLKKKRKVTLTFEFAPRDVDGSNLETVESSASVKLNIPNREARVNILCNDHKGGGLGFEPDTTVAKHHRNQATLPLDEEPASTSTGNGKASAAKS